MSDDDLKAQWLEHCLHLAGRPSGLWSHDHKIHRNQRITLTFDHSLGIEDIGYTNLKILALKRLYVHQASIDAALEQWEKGNTSVAFHCFNHSTKRAGLNGTQGPCLLSVTVTRVGNDVVANVAYRTVEIFKKFAGDLIFLRDTLLQPFGVSTVTCHFANLTCNQLFFPILFPLLDDPVAVLRDLQRRDPRFWRVIVRDADDLLNGGKRNANYMQAKRVAKHVLERIDRATLNELRSYLRKSSQCPISQDHSELTRC